MMHRIFLAINLSKEIKKELLRYQEKWPDIPAKWTKPENLHITLVFLGNTSDKELLSVQKTTREVALHHKPFSLSFSQIAYEPIEPQAQMIWVKGKESKELLSLKKDLAAALGQKEEQPFSLHITLARLKEWEFRKIEPEERPEINEEISLEVPVSSFSIMESKLKQGGAEYIILESISL
ncbi:MAG: RNA 2',3'-cyclic phosphodiesterase [bacterium]|nr:RNA 2',3'-cyclic phosphodiesterase [bacterium]